MAVFQLGEYEFLDLAGTVIVPAEELEVEVRDGVPGEAIFLRGERGEAFILEGHRDEIDQAEARRSLKAFCALTGTAVKFIQNDFDWETEFNLQFTVLKVEPVEARKNLMFCGTPINPPSEGWSVVRFTLLAFTVEETS